LSFAEEKKADTGHLEVAQLLVVKGTDMNLRSEKDSTALDWATEKAAQLLIASGAIAP
jgi:hypothetical protein